MAQTPVALGRTVKCANCGATLELSPDALAYVCKYCGQIGIESGLETKGFLMAQPQPSAQAEARYREYLERQLKGVYAQTRPLEFKALGLPMWIVKVHARTRYNGYRQETRTETYTVPMGMGRGRQSQTRVRSYPVYIPVRGEFDEVLTYPLLGRKHAAFFGVEEVKKRVLSAPTKPLDVRVFLQNKAELLDVELDESETRAIAESLAEDEHRKRAEQMTTRLFDCYTDDQVEATQLVFYPVDTAKYAYRNRSFRVTLDGVTGEAVKAELPMTLGLRVGYALAAYVGIALATVAGFVLTGTDEPAVALIPMLGGAALAAWAFLKASAVQRIKRG
jgi:hypothetical protein